MGGEGYKFSFLAVRPEVMGLAVAEVGMAGVAHGNRGMVGPWAKLADS